MGLSAAYGSWTEARGSTFQLLLNVVLLIVVGAFGLRLLRSVWRRRTVRAAARARRPSPDAVGLGPHGVLEAVVDGQHAVEADDGQ
jgi:hypothetical protein